jgi:hypothetical protein
LKMNFNFILRRLVAALAMSAAALAAGPLQAAGQQPASDAIQRLERSLLALQEELARLRGEASGAARMDELERRLDLLAVELEKVRSASGQEEVDLEGRRGLAPAASKVYGVTRGVSLGGYGEAVYENFAKERQDDRPSGRTDQFDFLRQILYVGYKFNDTILFNSEIEFEHASTGRGGEVSVEFAYVELAPSPKLGVRAGMLLVPMGFLNELHEPPIFHGARRPEVEQAIVPSTWRENGAGLFGELGPVAWRAYVVSSLSSAGFTASGLRGGRQSGARSRAEDLALTARADFTGLPGLLVGASAFTGETGQGVLVDGEEIDGRVTLFEGHAQYEVRGLRLRALAARSTVSDVPLMNQVLQLTGNRSVGERQAGWYAEAAYDLMTLWPAGGWAVTPFVRYERLDTQDRVPSGFARDPATDRRVVTAGVGVKPIANVVFKADHQWHRNEARTGARQLNLAVGYLF